MADPDKYNRTYSFNDFQAGNPSKPLPGVQVDNELENVEQSLGEAIDAINDVRRSDGALKNGIVTVDSLDPQVAAGVGTGALASAAAAAASADAASDSAVAAAASATAADTSKTAASGYVIAASGYASTAQTYRNEAGTERTLAQTARTGAQTARDFAAAWASAAGGVDVDDGVNPVSKSSYHWAQVALGAATGALPDNSVSTSKIVDGAVTEGKLAPEVRDLLAVGINVTTRTAMKALNTASASIAFLTEAGREGLFKWTTGDFTSRHALDPYEGVWVKADGVASSAGSWERVDKQELDIRGFGASLSQTPAENSARIQAAINVASAIGVKLHVRGGGSYPCAGGIFPRSKLQMEWDIATWLQQTAYSSTGAFFTNVSPIQSERAVSDVLLINPQIDLSPITYEPSYTAGSENCLGFARGAERIKVIGGTLKGARPNFNSSGGWGGKAVGLDGGVKNFTMIGTRLESCLYGIWVRGNENQFAEVLDGYERTSSIKFIGCHIEDCQLPIAINGRDPNEDPDYRAEDISVQIIATTYHNCGFCPDRPASNSNRYKAGLINLGEAQNFLIDGLTGYNDDDYVAQKGGWPTTGSVIGQGLSGAPCHIITGWGGNGTIRNVHHQGAVEDHWHCGRAYAMGDDAAPTRKVIVRHFLIDNVRHIGAAVNIFSQDDYDQVASPDDLRARMDNIYPFSITDGIVAANAASLNRMTIKVFQSDTRSIEGSPSFIYNVVGNVLSGNDTHSWTEDARVSKPNSYPVQTVGNNATKSFKLSKMDGLVAFTCNSSMAQGIIRYRSSASPQASIYGPATISSIAVTTGASPVGSAGTLTFSVDDVGNMWVNNQRGAALDITFNQLA